MWTFERKMMSLFFNMLSRLVIAFLLRCRRLNFRAAVTICSDFGVQEKKVCHCFHCFPMYFPWSDRTGCSDDLAFIVVVVVVLMLSFKPAFLLSFFTFFKRLFSSSSLSAIRVVMATQFSNFVWRNPWIFLHTTLSSLDSFLRSELQFWLYPFSWMHNVPMLKWVTPREFTVSVQFLANQMIQQITFQKRE